MELSKNATTFSEKVAFEVISVGLNIFHCCVDDEPFGNELRNTLFTLQEGVVGI